MIRLKIIIWNIEILEHELKINMIPASSRSSSSVNDPKTSSSSSPKMYLQASDPSPTSIDFDDFKGDGVLLLKDFVTLLLLLLLLLFSSMVVIVLLLLLSVVSDIFFLLRWDQGIVGVVEFGFGCVDVSCFFEDGVELALFLTIYMCLLWCCLLKVNLIIRKICLCRISLVSKPRTFSRIVDNYAVLPSQTWISICWTNSLVLIYVEKKRVLET